MINNGYSFDYKRLPDGLLISVSGEIDHHAAISLRRDVDKLVWASPPSKLVLDMSGVEFMDSSGLGFIMGRYALMRELGGSMILRNPSSSVSRMLLLTGFDRRVQITQTKNERRNER